MYKRMGPDHLVQCQFYFITPGLFYQIIIPFKVLPEPIKTQLWKREEEQEEEEEGEKEEMVP